MQNFTPEDFIRYPLLAQKYGLLESAGSDFHYETDEDCVIIGHGIRDNLLREDCSVKKLILERNNNHG